MLTNQYFKELHRLLDKVEKTQTENIIKTACKLVDTIIKGGKVFVFGCTHAGILAQEMFYRTGGLAIVNPLLPPGLTCDVRPITLTSQFERLQGFGCKVIEQSPIGDGDMLIIHSVSGRNNVPVDMAMTASEKNAYVVSITNIAYSSESTSRHESGKRLFEVSDLVIDNCGCFGDATLSIDGFAQRVSPSSTVIGAAIINAIVAEATSEFLKRNITPPVFVSANIDGGDEHNKVMLEKYKDQIFYL